MRVPLLAAAAAVALAAGCGGSRLSHGKYVERANAICADYRSRVEKLRAPRSLTEIETYARRTLTLYRSALAQLETLEPAKADEATVREWLAVDRRIAADVEEIADAAGRRSIPDVQAATSRSQTHDRRSNELASELGLTTCIAT